MLPYIYAPKINLGILSLNTWGLIVAVGFLIALFYGQKRAEKNKISKEHVYNLTLLALFTGIIGSRLLFILTSHYPLTRFFNLWEGGLAFIGGLVTAMLAVLIYIKKKKLNLFLYLDTLTPPLILGHIIGRIACFVADGGHLGTATSLPWAILGRHPNALYEVIILSIILLAVLKIENKIKRQGITFFSYLLFYSFLRFLLDFFREEKLFIGLTSTQIILMPIFLFSLGIIIKRYIKH